MKRLPNSSEAHENAFYPWGDCMWISYQGHALPLPTTRGLELIWYLLQHPEEEIDCRRLYTFKRMPAELVGDCSLNALALDQSELGGYSLGPQSRQVILDDKAIQELKAKLAEIEADAAAMAHSGDAERCIELEAERDAILNELKRALTKKGRIRGIEPEEAKMRKAVWKAITSALSQLATVLPALAEHLNASIKTGWFCCYNPYGKLVWDLNPRITPVVAVRPAK